MATVYQVEGSRSDPDFIYDIQVRQCQDGSWQQRHIWHADQLGQHNPPRVDAWITSYRHTDADLARFSPVSA